MGRKSVFAFIAIVGYIVGSGIYVLIRLAIPGLLDWIKTLSPWLLQNPWFLESLFSGLCGAFVSLAIVYLWSKTITEI